MKPAEIIDTPKPDTNKKQETSRGAKFLYYVIPTLVMIAVLIYTAMGILRFQRALADRTRISRESREKNTEAVSVSAIPSKLLNIDGRWSFAGVEWDCSHAFLSDQLLDDWPTRPDAREIAARLEEETLSDPERRVLEMLRDGKFHKTVEGNLGIYSMDFDGFLLRIMTAISANDQQSERLLGAGMALAAGEAWETLTFSSPLAIQDAATPKSLLPMPDGIQNLCRRWNEERSSVFEIYVPPPDWSREESRRQLETFWEANAWQRDRQMTGDPFTAWKRNGKFVFVRFMGQGAGNIKIILLDGTVRITL